MVMFDTKRQASHQGRSTGNHRGHGFVILLALLISLLCRPARCMRRMIRTQITLPTELCSTRCRSIQNLDSQMPLEVPDRRARAARDARPVLRPKPAILVFTYYNCPNLCPIILHELSESLRTMQVEVGKESSTWSPASTARRRSSPPHGQSRHYRQLWRAGARRTAGTSLTAPEDSIVRLADTASASIMSTIQVRPVCSSCKASGRRGQPDLKVSPTGWSFPRAT